MKYMYRIYENYWSVSIVFTYKYAVALLIFAQYAQVTGPIDKRGL